MDTRSADYLRHRMAHFSTAIDETRIHFPNLSAFGKHPPSAPYYERYGILQLFQSLEADAGIRDELTQEFMRIQEKLRSLETERGEPLRCLLLQELSLYLDTYSAAVCHANLGRVDPDSDHELFQRGRIAAIVHELEKDHDLEEVKRLLCIMDRNLVTAFTRDEDNRSLNTSPAHEKIQSHPDWDRIEG